ncbi:hypothetical protein Dda_6053 [Drechslerella dactyloides]|uniref:Uncharacterized protein n=1 Tax=Drechslerella dactyloides TaxID=74499 RepID=A0AAD6IX13_DREDA|nr:hypothetical protein Dda_6053 [Drechslerella dactyloides]
MTGECRLRQENSVVESDDAGKFRDAVWVNVSRRASEERSKKTSSQKRGGRGGAQDNKVK